MRRFILRQAELKHLVLYVCEAAARVNQFLEVLGKDWLIYLATLSGSFKTFKFLKRLGECIFLSKKMDNSWGFFLEDQKYFSWVSILSSKW